MLKCHVKIPAESSSGKHVCDPHSLPGQERLGVNGSQQRPVEDVVGRLKHHQGRVRHYVEVVN